MNAQNPNDEPISLISDTADQASLVGYSKAAASVAQTLWRAEEDCHTPRPGGDTELLLQIETSNTEHEPRHPMSGRVEEVGNPPPHVGGYGDEGLLRLRPYQQAVFRDHWSGIVVLHWSRQIGKSFVLAAWAVYRLMSRPGRLVTVLSNSKENGAEFLLKCAEVCRLHGTRFETVVKTPGLDFEDMRMELRIRNKGKVGRIKVLAANPRTARGFSGDLILDEFAFHEDGNKIWEAAEPILASNKDFLCRIASTGNGKRNLFYRMVGDDTSVATDSHRLTQMGKERKKAMQDAGCGMENGGECAKLENIEHGSLVVENPTWTRSADSRVVAGMIVDGVPYIPGSWSADQIAKFRAQDSGSEGPKSTPTENCTGQDVQGPKLEDVEQGVNDVEALLSPAQWLPKPATSQVPQESCALRATWSSLKQEAREETSNGRAGVETSQGAGLFNVAAPGDPPSRGRYGGASGRTPGEGDEARTGTNVEDRHLSPAQWLPKPATSQLPQTSNALRATWSPIEAERVGPPPNLGGYVEKGRPYFVSRGGFKVSRVTRSMAHEMGVEIYDSQTRKPITPEQARAQALDKAAYDQNYECSFADESLALLTHELISAECDEDGVAEICEQNWTLDALELMRQAKSPLYAGLDVGRKVDLSVITVLERVGNVFWVRGMLRMKDMRLPEQEERLQQLRQCRQVRQICIDMTGLGLGLFEYAQRTMGEHMISGINFSSSVSATRVIREEGRNRETVRVTEAMAMEMLRVYEDRRMRQPRDWQLREDLRRPGKVTSPAGRVSIAAVRDGAGHADHFWSVALALEAAGGARQPFAWQSIPRRNRGLLI